MRQSHQLMKACRASASAVAFALSLSACSSDAVLLSSQRINSPSLKRSAVFEELDNGLGFGLGALIQEVHVVDANTEIQDHGGPSHSVVYWADISEYKGGPIEVKWLSDEELQITYEHSLTPGKASSRLGAVVIRDVFQ